MWRSSRGPAVDQDVQATQLPRRLGDHMVHLLFAGESATVPSPQGNGNINPDGLGSGGRSAVLRSSTERRRCRKDQGADQYAIWRTRQPGHVPHQGHIYQGANHGLHDDTTPDTKPLHRRLGGTRWNGSTSTSAERLSRISRCRRHAMTALRTPFRPFLSRPGSAANTMLCRSLPVHATYWRDAPRTCRLSPSRR